MLSALAFAGACFVGLASSGKPILCQPGEDILDYASRRARVLVIAGLDGDAKAERVLNDELKRFQASPSAQRFSITAIPLANPDKAALQFPPTGDAYAKNTESHHLWRWIGVHAPDLVVIFGPDSASLGAALEKNAPAGVGTIPSRAAELKKGSLERALMGLAMKASPAREEMRKRLNRSPELIARQFGGVYGHELTEAVYIQAMALIGRLRIGELADVERIVAPYIDGSKNSLDKPTGSHFSGHLVFAELAERTKNPKYAERVRAAADLAFEANGQPKEAMPFHSEMSDSFFMSCPILAAAGKLTGEAKYYDMALRHFRFMQKLDLRPDGIYRHSPLDDAAWGRGNGFPALGMMLTLTYLPKDHPAYAEILAAFQKHMEALARFEDPAGMWHEVIDAQGSYAEFTATAMIAMSMKRGIRNGWLPAAKYQPMVDQAWQALKLRMAADGRLIDVCTGTGKQKDKKAYFDRTAILGTDPRGGAMALLVSTEMGDLQ